MGNKVSAATGVKSPNFYEPGNAVNELRVGDLEIISRLPFGSSDMEQAGWPKGDWPKIPWHKFIIPRHATLRSPAERRAPSNGSLRQSPAKPLVTPAAQTSISWFPMIQAIMLLLLPLLCIVPVYLALAYGAISSTLGIADPRLFQEPSDPENWDTALPTTSRATQLRTTRLYATRLRAIIGSVVYVSALLLAISDGFAVSVSHFCQYSSTCSGLSMNRWVSAYVIFGTACGMLLAAATFSVFCLWSTYLRDRTQGLKTVDVGEKCRNIGSIRVSVHSKVA